MKPIVLSIITKNNDHNLIVNVIIITINNANINNNKNNIVSMMMKDYNTRCSSHGHHDSKSPGRELAQHAHSRTWITHIHSHTHLPRVIKTIKAFFITFDII